MPEPVPPKYIFKSKTAVAGALVAIAGALGSYAEPVGTFLSTHASGIMMILGAGAVLLRMATKGAVQLFKE